MTINLLQTLLLLLTLAASVPLSLQLELSAADFKTSDFRVYREDQELDKKRKIQGYRARHEIRLEVPLEMERVNRIVATCAASGAEPAIEVNFGVKHPEPMRQQLLAAAVGNARQRAEILAQTAGVRLGPIQRIDYGMIDVHVTSRSYELRECMVAEGPDIVPEDLDASDKVTVTWEIV